MENEIEIFSSAANANVKVLCKSSGSAATPAIHKEKFNVPIDASHKDLLNFTKHLVAFTDFKRIASTKGLGHHRISPFLQDKAGLAEKAAQQVQLLGRSS